MRFVSPQAAAAFAGRTQTIKTPIVKTAIKGTRPGITAANVNTGRSSTMIRPGVTMTPGETHQAIKMPSDLESMTTPAEVVSIGTPPKEKAGSNKILLIGGAILAGMLLLSFTGVLKPKHRR